MFFGKKSAVDSQNAQHRTLKRTRITNIFNTFAATKTVKNMRERYNSKAFLLIFLGTLTAFGPLVTDMYLPTLPEMTGYFSTSSSMVQLGLTASMTGLAAGQLLFGPVSDRYGRRPPLVIAMTLFLLSTLGCILARDIFQFVAWRLVQGVAGAGSIVISRSVAADKYRGQDLAKMLAVIGAINGVAPVAAPMIGGMVSGSWGWKGIFWILMGLGTILLAGSIHFSESLPAAQRVKGNWKNVFRSAGSLFRNKVYVWCVLQFAFAQAVLFANISSAPFIMQEHFGFTPMMFSICFGINAVAIVVAAAASVRFRTPDRALRCGSIGMVAASVLLGALGFAAGGIVSPLVGLGNIMSTTGIIFAAGSVCSYVCTRRAASA